MPTQSFAEISAAVSLRVVDSLRVTVLVDNTTDLLTAPTTGVTSHVQNLLQHRPQLVLSGEHLCCANWGLALGVDVQIGPTAHRVLFDGGPDPASLRRNAGLLGYDLSTIDAAALSHGHWDHAGGLATAFRRARSAGRAGLTAPELHAAPGMFVRRGKLMAGGAVLRYRDVPSPSAFEALGARLHIDEAARTFASDTMYFSDEIPRVTAYERGFPGHVRWNIAQKQWEDDAWIRDERWLGIHVRGKGLVVLSSCSHAGIVNVLHHARMTFPHLRLHAVMGGLHLSGPSNELAIDQTVDDLQQFSIDRLIPGHCTGRRATAALSARFGEVVTPLSVGETHTFMAEGAN